VIHGFQQQEMNLVAEEVDLHIKKLTAMELVDLVAAVMLLVMMVQSTVVVEVVE
tara:strand:- start:29 stop:190 length:162 start_codon:yes stop_codon:yes gene_type:complete